MLSYDRPGYSREANGDSEPDISVQGRLLAELVRLTMGSAKGVILISHSFGGPIAAMAADELGEVVIGHVMIAPVISPQCEPDFWYSSIPHTFPFTLFSSHGWKVASTEKRFHREYLKETTHVWQDISYEVIHFHGSDDWLAPIENVHFAEASIPERWYHPVILEGKSHFILWTEREQITREILRLAERN
jgi:pimeloyl-ACP methyl ester carboxylesterase